MWPRCRLSVPRVAVPRVAGAGCRRGLPSRCRVWPVVPSLPCRVCRCARWHYGPAVWPRVCPVRVCLPTWPDTAPPALPRRGTLACPVRAPQWPVIGPRTARDGLSGARWPMVPVGRIRPRSADVARWPVCGCRNVRPHRAEIVPVTWPYPARRDHRVPRFARCRRGPVRVPCRRGLPTTRADTITPPEVQVLPHTGPVWHHCRCGPRKGPTGCPFRWATGRTNSGHIER